MFFQGIDFFCCQGFLQENLHFQHGEGEVFFEGIVFSSESGLKI